MSIFDKFVFTAIFAAACFLISGSLSSVLSNRAIKKRTSFDDCKVISDVGYNTVYSCPEGIIYVVKKK